MVKCGEKLSLNDIMSNIEDAFDSLSVDEISRIHNDICNSTIEYERNGLWEVVGTDY